MTEFCQYPADLIYAEKNGSVCLECGAAFIRKTAKSLTCSDVCQRNRKLRYGAEYRQSNRDLRARVHALFGGRAPTKAEIMKIIQSNRTKEKIG